MRNLFSLFLLLFPFTLIAQDLKPLDNGSEVNFAINNFGLSTKGKLKGLNGSIIWNAADLNASSINVSVETNTINTDNKLRDGHLRKEDYFNVAKFPLLQIKSTKITALETAGQYQLEAQLSIKGVTKKVNFPFTVTSQKPGYLFSGNFEINRRDYGIGGGSISLSNTVKINLKVLAQ
jgi:polyisoprenoid-binding protein YceI